jgi:hypothetical protein
LNAVTVSHHHPQRWTRLCMSLAAALVWGAPSWASAVALVSLHTPVLAQVQPIDFGQERPSNDVRALANGVMQSGDHQALPFVLVDKHHARVFVFDRHGRLQGAAPALLGLARGDEGIAGMGDRPLSSIQPWERTTPAGRFVATMGRNVSDQAILWVDYEQGISLHPVRSHPAKERRLQRLASPEPDDNRISYGCINVPVTFWHKVLVPTFAQQIGVVYVLPDTLPLSAVFVMPLAP